MKIYIDIGHGGSDPGAVSGNFIEHQMAIVTGMAMADRLMAYGHQGQRLKAGQFKHHR